MNKYAKHICNEIQYGYILQRAKNCLAKARENIGQEDFYYWMDMNKMYLEKVNELRLETEKV